MNHTEKAYATCAELENSFHLLQYFINLDQIIWKSNEPFFGHRQSPMNMGILPKIFEWNCHDYIKLLFK